MLEIAWIVLVVLQVVVVPESVYAVVVLLCSRLVAVVVEVVQVVILPFVTG
jgi:hypothetical protein